ncbi:MAG: FecR family protein [Reyranellaceae bacterium]
MQGQRQDPPIEEALIEEALRWFGVLKDPKASESDRLAFASWLKEKPEHEAAWRQAQKVWMRVGKIGPAFANSPQATVVMPKPSPVKIEPPILRATPSLRPIAPRRPSPTRRRGLLIAAAAMAAVAAPAAALLWRPGLLAGHSTAVGERRTIALPDGSMVELAGASAISMEFTADLRRIVLRDGEAFFEVVGDAARPFIVDAGATRTRAVGTAFDVKLVDGAVMVATKEQSVEVSADGRAPVVVGSGQQVRYDRGSLGDVRDADLAKVEAWRQDRLTFHDAPLGDVVADLQRYRLGRILLTEARLGDMPVTAEIDTRQTDAALEAIAATLPVRAWRLTSLLVVLSPRS